MEASKDYRNHSLIFRAWFERQTLLALDRAVVTAEAVCLINGHMCNMCIHIFEFTVLHTMCYEADNVK